MELIPVLLYFLTLALMPFLLLVTAYYAYFHEDKILEVVLRLIAAVIGYLAITAPTVLIFGIIMFAEAHSDHGQEHGFDFRGWIVVDLIVLTYIGICYLLVCLVKGGLIKPWKLFVGLSNKHISIFEPNER